jgi:hypothetical protein
MTRLFSTTTRLEAWLEAAEFLVEAGRALNVILSIDSPGSDGPVARQARSLVDEFYASEGEYPLHTVAETIFPAWEYRHRGLRGVFDTYGQEYAVLKHAEPHRWGTYAHRLIRRRTATGDSVNPLEGLIEKMRSEREQENRGSYRACYELGVAEGEYDVPLYNTVDDQGRRRGGPCLSHLSFKLDDGRVHLTAIYRSHDYRYKALGNLLGLARLQACVAKEVEAELGTLVVHSTYAYTDTRRGRKPFTALLAALRAMCGERSSGVADGIR